MPALRARLTAFCGAPRLHARFLNTLSLMEHIGSRKIMATQSGVELDNDTLKHLAEESRHAFFFKRAAEKLARRKLDYGADATIAGASARAYMGRLDAGIEAALPPTRPAALPYLYMSLIVELRAIWLYRLYRDILDSYAIGIALKSVLAEEELHLSAMLGRIGEMAADSEIRIAGFARLEDRQFRIAWRAIEDACEIVAQGAPA